MSSSLMPTASNTRFASASTSLKSDRQIYRVVQHRTCIIFRVGQIRIHIIIRTIRFRYIRRIFQPPPAISEFRISVYTPYSCRILLGNSKPQPLWSWLEPVIVKEATDGVEGLVCKLECIKGGGVCGKLLGIVNPSRSAKEHATERGCRGHTYIRYLKLRIYGI